VAPEMKLVSVMSKIAHAIVGRTRKYFPITLVAFGLIATVLWSTTVMGFALVRIWSVVPFVG
jgi:hypothetical protein